MIWKWSDPGVSYFEPNEEEGTQIRFRLDHFRTLHQNLVDYFNTNDLLKYKMKVLLVLVISLGVGMIPAFADIQTPLQQFNQGIPSDEIQCRDSKILMKSPSQRPACVNESTAELLLNRGFVTVKLEVKPNNIQTKNTYTNNEPIFGGHGTTGPTPKTPLYTVEIPDTITVGETVSIPYTMSWHYPNGTFIFDGRIDEQYMDELFAQIDIQVSDEFTVLNDNKEFSRKYADTYTTHTATAYYFIETYSEDMISGSIDIRLDTPLFYDIDLFSLSVGFLPHFFTTQKTDTGVIITAQDIVIDSGNLQPSPEMSIISNDWINGRYDMRYSEDVTHIPKLRVAQASEIPPQSDYLPRHTWSDYAVFVRSATQRENVTDIREWILDASNLSNEFVDDFFAEYPEFAKLRTNVD